MSMAARVLADAKEYRATTKTIAGTCPSGNSFLEAFCH